MYLLPLLSSALIFHPLYFLFYFSSPLFLSSISFALNSSGKYRSKKVIGEQQWKYQLTETFSFIVFFSEAHVFQCLEAKVLINEFCNLRRYSNHGEPVFGRSSLKWDIEIAERNWCVHFLGRSWLDYFHPQLWVYSPIQHGPITRSNQHNLGSFYKIIEYFFEIHSRF